MDTTLDPHARPPDFLVKRFKELKRTDDDQICDIASGRLNGFTPSFSAVKELSLPDDIQTVIDEFVQSSQSSLESKCSAPTVDEHQDLPGLFILPSLLPASAQIHLLSSLLHRDIIDPAHNNNLKVHYQWPGFTTSLFSQSPSLTLTPHDPSVHKPLSVQTILDRKLRWITLGAQYDWTLKQYPSTNQSPPFPPDIKALIEGLIPSTRAEAAIANLYSPGDTLSLHRDVSEECARPLVSISLGCEALFLVGLDDKSVTLRLRSGDVLVMAGRARTAWHAVPRVLAGTCPAWMSQWPANHLPDHDAQEGSMYEHWRGWMAGKRINLNIRQMYD